MEQGTPQPVLKTSKDWNLIRQAIIMDPDGWDRKNYDYSFNVELITEEEFNRRLFASSQMFRIQPKVTTV